MLDTLFFDFIELAKKLQPKVVVAENVKGMLLGDAQQYVDKILTAFDEAVNEIGMHDLVKNIPKERVNWHVGT